MQDRKKQPTAIDLFSGAGGMTLGLKLAGFKVVGAIEIDSVAVETYHSNHPDVFVWGKDIKGISVKQVMRKLKLREGDLDLLAGCPPCQGFSSIRTRNKGIVNDPRNELIFQFLRFVKKLKPKTVMMENTPELAKDWRMDQFVRQLNKLGYQGEYPILNAADYGVPQRRKRMVLMAGRFNIVPFPKPEKTTVTVRRAIGSLPEPGKSGDPLHDYLENRSVRIIDRIQKTPKDGGSRKDLGDNDQLPCHKNQNGFNDVYGRMSWGREAPTITGGCTNPSKGRFLHPEQNRAITLREAALLQSFPPDYHFSLSGGKQRASALIGNALPPEFVKRHARSIIDYLNKGSGAYDKLTG